MKQILDVVLKEGTDKQEFIDSFDPETQAELWNILSEIPNLISMNVEESFIETFKQDNRIVTVEERRESISPNIPPLYNIKKTITATTPATSQDGRNYAPLQFYLDTDQITSSQKVGANNWLDDTKTIPNANYSFRWTGKNVDIVTLEAGGGNIPNSMIGIHTSHPDFRDLVDTSVSRAIPMNWTDLEHSSNNQITSNNMFTEHAAGVLSVAGGSICGFAKRASLRACYDSTEDGVVECINAIISWHNSKSINPETGLRNPTIMIAEYQYLLDRNYGIKIDDIVSITDLNGTVNRPGNSWGTDFTPFTNRNIIPFQVRDPVTSSYEWCAVFPTQSRYTALSLALQNAWDAGIVCINAAGNNGGVYVKVNDPRYNGVYCTTSGTITRYDIFWSNSVSKVNTSTTRWYPFIPHGPHGEVKSIDVAAGYNSEGNPILDGYSNRGPGIDIVGLGANTWSAYPTLTYADGNKWGMFSGTSCATPTVVGKAACLMEKYFTYNKVWPTPDQTKSLLLSEAKKIVKSVKTTTWNNVPSSNTSITIRELGSNMIRITSGTGGNGSYQFSDLAGTTNLRSFFNPNIIGYDRKNASGKRPESGLVYPRIKSRIKRNDIIITEKNSEGPPPSVTITVTSSSIVNGGTIGINYKSIANGGTNTSPQLSWSVSGSTSEIAYYEIDCYEYDPDSVQLWSVTNIPPSTTSIAENGSWPQGSIINVINVNNQRGNGWYGPRYTVGTGITHNYAFDINARYKNGALLGNGFIEASIIS